MNVYDIIRNGSCAITRRMAEIESVWDAIGTTNATAHALWGEYEHLLDSLACIALGIENMVH